MDQELTSESLDEVAFYKATIDRYIADLRRIEQEMKADDEEIKQLQLETRRILNELLQAA
jgi:hypothetical protein